MKRVDVRFRPLGQRRLAAPPAPPRCARGAGSAYARPPPAARSRSRACAAAGPSSRSKRRARRRGCRRRSAGTAASGARGFARARRNPGPFSGRKCRATARRCSSSDALRSARRQFGFAGRQAEARAELARDAGADDRVIFLAALADVVQKRGDEQRAAVLIVLMICARQRQLGRERRPSRPR